MSLGTGMEWHGNSRLHRDSIPGPSSPLRVVIVMVATWEDYRGGQLQAALHAVIQEGSWGYLVENWASYNLQGELKFFL